MMMKKKGLTLMELLVVISILATLAALLFPVYLRVRSRIYAINCANQLRQIGLAIRMYAKDWGDDTPYSMPIGLGQLHPSYVRDRDLLVCPYFQALAPEVTEEMHQINQARWGSVWSSYSHVKPEGWDIIAKNNPGEVIGFAEVYAKRGDQTPIVWCTVHRMGYPKSSFPIWNSPKGEAFLQTSITWSLSEPLIILRWGGSVHFVAKGGFMIDTNIFMLDY